MKQCPKCGTTYADPSLSYCLSDGSVLEPPFEEPTFVRTTAEPPGHFRVEVPQEPPEIRYIPAHAAPASETSGLKIALIIVVVMMTFIGAAAIAGALIYFNKETRTAKNSTVQMPNVNANTPNANGSASAETETAKLREQIANLEKRLNEQKSSTAVPSNVPVPPDQPSTSSGSPTVNSPGDGFLALRSLPNSELGERLLKIPHGARVSISGCLPRTRVGNKNGRWCKASYNGYTGWLFDAWLAY